MDAGRRAVRAPALAIALALATVAALGPVAASEGPDASPASAAPFFYRVTNGATVEVLEALVDGRTAVEFYDYQTGDSSSHTGYEESNTLSIFLWSGPEGKSLVFMVDKENDGSGGSLKVNVAGLPAGASWLVKDDPNDAYTATGATWNWISCCTDGGVMDLATNDAIALNLTIPTASGVSTFRLFGGPADTPQFVTFDRTKPTLIETFQTPGAPSLSGSAGPGAGEVALMATPPDDDGGDPVTSYRFYRATAGVETFVGESADGTLAISGLADGESATFLARAVNLGGEGDDSPPVTIVTFDVPSAPQALTATAGPGAGEIALSWSAPGDDGGAPVTGYALYRDGAHLATLGDVADYLDTGLANGATHTYTVAATNLVGEGPASASATGATFDVPGAPVNLTAASGETLGTTAIAWEPPADDGGAPVTLYRVYGGSSPDNMTLLGETNATTFEDASGGPVPLPDARHYAVAAVNLVGEGARSATACGVPAPWGALAALACDAA